MSDLINSLKDAISALNTCPISVPFTDEEASAQSRAISAIRRVWSALPNSRIKEDAKEYFIEALTGSPPSEELISLATRTKRRRRLSEDELLQLERQQGSRCKLCGTLLIRSVEPHVDHVVPISLGGEDDITNYQLLCSTCNLGKGATLHWLMTLPFFDEGLGNESSPRLRYAVLQRFRGKCYRPDCNNCSEISEMFVLPLIGVPSGGRVIFDNLVVYCSEHRDEVLQEQFIKAKRAMRGTRKPGFSFP